MYRNILIPVALDHENLVSQKIEIARHLLKDDGQITLMTVLEEVPGFVAEFVDLKPVNHLKERVRKSLEAAHNDSADIKIVVESGKAGVMVTRYAQQHKTDLIIVGSHHPGVQDYFLGSTAARVARRAPCAVFIMR